MEGSKHLFTSTKLYWVCVCVLLLEFSRNTTSQSIVQYLPGFAGPLPFELETGYVSVDDLNGVQLFYYFVKSENNPTVDPLVFWFTGGPGCSTLTALAFEIGPVHFKIAEYNGSLPTLELNPYSWTKVANIIFLDEPVGTGFSYSKTTQGSYTSNTKTAKQAYTFLTKWLIDHPEFLSNPLYIGGDSYSGKVVPVLAQEISDGIQAGDKPSMNLKGYLLGNPLTDPDIEQNSVVPYAHGMGIISDELYESAKRNCGGDYVNVDPKNEKCTRDLQATFECTSGLNYNHILEPICFLATPKTMKLEETPSRNRLRSRNLLQCRSYGYLLSYYWANDARVEKALNIQKGTIQEWKRCNYGGVQYFEDVKNSISYHLNLSKSHYRSLIYSGDHDMIIPFLGTQEWIRSMNYSISDEWRPWLVEGQVAGYTRTYTNNMTFATVKGGGHTAPEYRPKECFSMFKRWLSYEHL